MTGAAWAVPTLAVTTSAPALAVSPVSPVSPGVTITGQCPQNGTVAFAMNIWSPVPAGTTITFEYGLAWIGDDMLEPTPGPEWDGVVRFDPGTRDGVWIMTFLSGEQPPQPYSGTIRIQAPDDPDPGAISGTIRFPPGTVTSVQENSNVYSIVEHFPDGSCRTEHG
jgi:hypothetical protein